MVIHRDKSEKKGMKMLVSDAGKDEGLRLDFGILNLAEGEIWENAAERERALLLIQGQVEWEWEGMRQTAVRSSCFDESPEVLHVPAGMAVRVRASGRGTAELCYEACRNKQSFSARYYGKEDIRNDVFGAGTLNETSIRTVRTVFDGENAEFSNMVLGEVVNHPGKWSSYPPHDHPHPEIYHYRMLPEQGFGVSLLEDEAHLVYDGSTSLIRPGLTHSQVAAPGYAMYYLWMIPHLPGDRWLPSTRYFRKEHEWLLKDGIKVWPEEIITEQEILQ